MKSEKSKTKLSGGVSTIFVRAINTIDMRHEKQQRPAGRGIHAIFSSPAVVSASIPSSAPLQSWSPRIRPARKPPQRSRPGVASSSASIPAAAYPSSVPISAAVASLHRRDLDLLHKSHRCRSILITCNERLAPRKTCA